MNLDQATISPAAGPKYDADYLNQLKASTPTARPRITDVDPLAMDVEPMDVVSLEGTPVSFLRSYY